MGNESREVRQFVRRQRRRRIATGVNVAVAVLLMTAAVVLLNVLVSRFPARLQLKSRSRVTLSERTLGLLHGLSGEIDVVGFLASDSQLYDEVRILLREYAYVAASLESVTLNLEIVDPRRDIARTRELARKYDVTAEDVIVFSCAGRRKYIEIKDLAQYEVELTQSGVARRMVGFLGEQAFSSAILSVTQEHSPVIYFVTGHGERDTEDFGRQGGYSAIARSIRHDNMEVRRLQLAEHGAVPQDCAALIVAGPDRRLSDVEIRCLEDYLKNRHGRVMLLLDPSIDTGLGSLL
jgi:hypothetical protein